MERVISRKLLFHTIGMKLFVFISISECANFLHHSYLVVLVVLMCAQKTFGSLLALSNDV